MNKILIATFESEDALKAVEHDLMTATISGFPREKILVEKERKEVKVITPAATEAEIRKVFQDHRPKDLREEEWKD